MTDYKQKNLNQGQPPEEYTSSLTDILLILAHQIKIILILPTILCTMTIVYVLFIAKPVYVASAKIMSSSGGGSSEMVGLASQLGIHLPMGQSEPNWLNKDIVTSRTLARAMLKRKFDTNEFGSQKSLFQILTYGNEEPGIGLDTLTILAVNKLLGMIGFSENARTRIYTVSMSASEPQFAAELTAALIEELDSRQRAYNKAKTSKTRQFIEERIVDSRKELETAEETLKNFADHNRRIENSPLLLLEQQRLSREVAVLTGVYTTLKQQLETTKIEEVRESEYVVILDPPEVPLQRSKPNKRSMVIWAGFLGIGLGIAIGFLRDYADNREENEKEKLRQLKSLIIKYITEMYHDLHRLWKIIIPFK